MDMKNSTFDGYAILDTETTGLQVINDKIIEVAIVLADKNGTITDHWDSLLNPQQYVKGTQIHGITDSMVKDAPYFEDVALQMSEMLNNRILVAHNASFDARFLGSEFGNFGIQMDVTNFLCTLKISRKLFPKKPHHKLENMASQFNVSLENAHAAIADTVACAEVFQHLKTQPNYPSLPFTARPFISPEFENSPNDTITYSRLPDFTCVHCDEMPW